MGTATGSAFATVGDPRTKTHHILGSLALFWTFGFGFGLVSRNLFERLVVRQRISEEDRFLNLQQERP